LQDTSKLKLFVAEEPNPVLTGLAGAFEPILKLPAVLSYPLIILIVGGVSAIFLPLFGSGSIGSMTGRVAETAPPPETADKQQFAVTACDETCVAKKKMARSDLAHTSIARAQAANEHALAHTRHF
jgi:hypothetical protein